ncbi:MAG: Peptidase sortase-like protein [Parcubacteria group bacterium]|nr:Peptidase sortase-like protein [Parcubacteria group bacterium]
MNTNSLTVKTAVKLVKASKTAYYRKWAFLSVFVLVFFITTGIAAALDVLPDPTTASNVYGDTTKLSVGPLVSAPIATPELPVKIEIPAIKLSVSVSNPESTNVEVLDNALLKGAVRYPTSAKLGEQGNVIIFGHSSYLPLVNNQNFKAFDGIQNLKQGDQIAVTGSGHVYVYSVETVVKANATEDSIPLTVEGSKLTLATCNSFGQKSDRFVVTANLVETHTL